MAITSTQHHGQDVSQHPEGSSTAAAQAPARVVLLDNRDSFVYNLVDQFATLGSQIEVYRNNVPASRVLAALEPTAAEREAGRRPVLCLSPGPGYPATSGCLMELIATALEQTIPTLGICLGFQALVEACGGRVAPVGPVHGRSDRVEVTEAGRTDPAFTVLNGGPLDVSAWPAPHRRTTAEAAASSWRPGTGRYRRSGCSSTPSRSSPRRDLRCSRPSPPTWLGPPEPRRPALSRSSRQLPHRSGRITPSAPHASTT